MPGIDTGPSSYIPEAVATKGALTGTPGQDAALASSGIIMLDGDVSDAPAMSFSDLFPLDGASDAVTRPKITFKIQNVYDFTPPFKLNLRAKQTPFGPVSPDGWETLLIDGAFQPGLDPSESVLEVDPLDPRVLVAELQLAFAWIPGAAIRLEVDIEDVYGRTLSFFWEFDTNPYISQIDDRGRLTRLTRNAYAWGWPSLIQARALRSYTTGFSGSDLEVTINESLLADLGDQTQPDDLPPVAANPRIYRLLARESGYAVDPYDPLSELIFEGEVSASIPRPVFPDRTHPGECVLRAFINTARTERQRRYFTLFMLLPPSEENGGWVWAWSEGVTTSKAFSFGKYGHGAVMFGEVSSTMQIEDS